jgi:saccharopine dehydrogenase (NADP+, L-glutamate forming)
VIRRLQREGAIVRSFASYGGAIPAPDANTNPWGYKFTWSPRGVVVAARNPVRYLENGQVVLRTFPDLFRTPRHVFVPGIGELEAYPNRDCLRYVPEFGLNGVQEMFRGSLRYRGWCDTWHALFDLGLLDLEVRSWCGLTYAQFLDRHLGEPDGRPLVQRLARRLGVHEDDELIARLEWLGLLSDRMLPSDCMSSLDILTVRLQRMLQYREGEHDMAVMEHHFEVERADGRLRRIVSRLILHGTAGDDSALARTVSYPAAIACRLILGGRVSLAGVRIPVDEQLTLPILLGLDRRGLHVHEHEEDLDLPGQ